jgi:hypothetical protein
LKGFCSPSDEWDKEDAMDMKSRWITVPSMIVAAFLGGFVSNLAFRAMPEAHAQAEARFAPGRLQVSAYAGPTPNGELKRGVYVLDTFTGVLYHQGDGAGFSQVDVLQFKR